MRTVRRLAGTAAFLLSASVLALTQDTHPTQTIDPTPTSKPASLPASQAMPPNLLFNGEFELLDEAAEVPAGWTAKHPDNVRLIDLGGWHGRVLEMTGDRKLMATYGVDLTSEKIPVEPNLRYRCTGFTRSDGPNIKVFVKGYATVTRRISGELKTFDDVVYQMRKDIAPSEDWQPFNLEFLITPASVFSDFQHRVEYVRIRLWAYWPVGTCWFDEIRFERVAPVPEGKRRHGEAVTHVGLPPRLGKAASQPGSIAAAGRSPSDDASFDEEQTWRDAANAFRIGDHKRAARLAAALIARAPDKGTYRILAARALAEFGQWDEAEQHARWLLEEPEQHPDKNVPPHQIENWQRDWARVVLARASQHAGRTEQARAILEQLLQASPSAHARAAAEKLLTELPPPRGDD